SYTNAGKLSDDDTSAVIAYLRSLPAAGAQTPDPPDRFNLLGLAMLGAGLLPSGKPVSTAVVTAPPKSPTSEFGAYILSYQDCRECHGRQLTGGVPGQLAPLGPDLSVVKDWTRVDFIATFRTGVDPNGHELGKVMPWRPLGRMDDDELTAIYEYLTHLPPG
ncbi:c-type cytochrome, partial [Bradyrhizobium sp.]|uniref:c-type cytochrome n=1 Tax=Bradyrhizobium sp. TaxID=376 RepID=UPI003C428179